MKGKMAIPHLIAKELPVDLQTEQKMCVVLLCSDLPYADFQGLLMGILPENKQLWKNRL